MRKGSHDISKSDSIIISKKIKDEIFKPAFTFKTTVFLCGADINQKDTIRHKISQSLLKNSGLWFDLIYPEDIFDELLYSSKTIDLLSLEGLLADSVDVIVIIPESPGSYSELGAFANDEKLRKKLICVVDKKYKKYKSFINQGPLKLVKKENNYALIYIDSEENPLKLDKLVWAMKKMKKSSIKKDEKLSLLQLENFILPSIYLLEPVTKQTLISLVSSATKDEQNSFQTTTTALTILIKKNLVKLSNDGYKLTRLGLEKFFAFKKTKTRIKRHSEKINIDNIRLEILNLKNRNKKLEV